MYIFYVTDLPKGLLETYGTGRPLLEAIHFQRKLWEVVDRRRTEDLKSNDDVGYGDGSAMTTKLGNGEEFLEKSG